MKHHLWAPLKDLQRLEIIRPRLVNGNIRQISIIYLTDTLELLNTWGHSNGYIQATIAVFVATTTNGIRKTPWNQVSVEIEPRLLTPPTEKYPSRSGSNDSGWTCHPGSSQRQVPLSWLWTRSHCMYLVPRVKSQIFGSCPDILERMRPTSCPVSNLPIKEIIQASAFLT